MGRGYSEWSTLHLPPWNLSLSLSLSHVSAHRYFQLYFNYCTTFPAQFSYLSNGQTPRETKQNTIKHCTEDRVGAPEYFSTRNHRICIRKYTLSFCFTCFPFASLSFLVFLKRFYLLYSTHLLSDLNISLSLSFYLSRSLTKWLEYFCCLLSVCYRPL